MFKKRTPTSRIEHEQKIYSGERTYVKFPGENVFPTTFSSGIGGTPYGGQRQTAQDNNDLIASLWHNHGKKRYTHLHTHPYLSDNPLLAGRKLKYTPLPSEGDMYRLLSDDSAKAMAIAQVNKDTNKIEGYFYLRKTKETKPTGLYGIDKDETIAEMAKQGTLRGFFRVIGMGHKLRKILKSTNQYYKEIINVQRADKPEQIFPLVEKLAEKYHLQYRFVPAEGFQLDNDKSKFIEKPLTLEQIASSTTAIIASLGSLFFTTLTFTGNAIGILSNNSTNLIGIILFLIGIVATFFYINNLKSL